MRIPLYQYALWGVGLWLEILLLIALLRGAYRKYTLIFGYAIALFLTTVIEVSTYTAAISGARTFWRSRAFYYWINEAILQVLVYAIVIELIYKASKALGHRMGNSGAPLRRWLVPVSGASCSGLGLVSLGPLAAPLGVDDPGQPRPELLCGNS